MPVSISCSGLFTFYNMLFHSCHARRIAPNGRGLLSPLTCSPHYFAPKTLILQLACGFWLFCPQWTCRQWTPNPKRILIHFAQNEKQYKQNFFYGRTKCYFGCISFLVSFFNIPRKKLM